MKTLFKRIVDNKKAEDDNLFGLLSSYKSYNTYLSLYASEKDDSLLLFITDNPKRWSYMLDEKYKNFHLLKRLEMDVPKMSIKYLLPEHLIKSLGPLLGMKLPSNKATIVNNISHNGYFIMQTALKYLPDVVQEVKKIINMSPQKKYEILEKCLAENA
jgi:hypothetical protein